MKMKIKYSILFFTYLLLSTFSINAQKLDTASIIAYIKLYKDIAVSEMQRTGIPASITLAQGIHESGFGKSYLAQNTNNHFGIKCKEEWKGKTFKYADDAPSECFRVYDKVEDSYIDHSNFLKYRPRYADLFLLDKYDYKGWSYGLKKAGYATNPKYPVILIKTIEDFELTAFDKGINPAYLQTTLESINKPIANDEQLKKDAPEIIQHTFEVEKKTVIESVNKQNTVPVSTKKLNKTITKINKCKTVKIYPSKGETLDLIGNVMRIDKEKLLIFNDVNDDYVWKDGQTIFIQQKKKSNKTEPSYKVKQEDNLWSISQKKGVRLSSLLKMNKLSANEEPAVKETIMLKGKSKLKPALRSQKNTDSTIKNTIVSTPTKNVIYDTIIRARDTVYPNIQTDAKLSVDSNKILGWESETKLLEKPSAITYPVQSKPESIVTVEKTNTTTADMPTVYPKTIDYAKLPKSSTGLHTVIKGDTMYNICKRYNITTAQLMEWNNLSDQSVKLGQELKIQQ